MVSVRDSDHSIGEGSIMKVASLLLGVLALLLVAANLPAQADTFTTACADVRTSPGTITSGSYVDTQGADDAVTENMQETSSGGASHLTHVWKFCNVPAGALSLVYEGTRATNSDGDNFQFYYNLSCDPGGDTGFQTITGAIINHPFYPTGGLTSSMNITTTATVDIYLMIKDTAAGSNNDTVKIDYLAIKTVP